MSKDRWDKRAMPESKQRIERHNELWRQGSKDFGRLVTGIVIFAVLVVYRVFTPLVQNSVVLSGQKPKLQKVMEDLQGIENEKAPLALEESRLMEIQRKIQDEPWIRHKDDLVSAIWELNETYDRMPGSLQALRRALDRESNPGVQRDNARPVHTALQKLGLGGDLMNIDAARYQALLDTSYHKKVQERADAAVREIERSVHECLVKPFAGAAEDAGGTKLRKITDAFQEDLRKWSADHLQNEAWYPTIRDKNRTLSELTSLLTRRQREFLRPVQARLQALEAQRKTLNEEVAELNQQQTVLTGKINSLEARLENILPSWAKGFVVAPDMKGDNHAV